MKKKFFFDFLVNFFFWFFGQKMKKIFFDFLVKKFFFDFFGQKKFFSRACGNFYFFDFLAKIFFDARTLASACACAQAFIGHKLDRSSSISYQIIILDIFFHGRTDRIHPIYWGQAGPVLKIITKNWTGRVSRPDLRQFLSLNLRKKNQEL